MDVKTYSCMYYFEYSIHLYVLFYKQYYLFDIACITEYYMTKLFRKGYIEGLQWCI